MRNITEIKVMILALVLGFSSLPSVVNAESNQAKESAIGNAQPTDSLGIKFARCVFDNINVGVALVTGFIAGYTWCQYRNNNLAGAGIGQVTSSVARVA